eukprot:972388-Pelagomonas_calceolata.AAC.2
MQYDQRSVRHDQKCVQPDHRSIRHDRKCVRHHEKGGTAPGPVDREEIGLASHPLQCHDFLKGMEAQYNALFAPMLFVTALVQNAHAPQDICTMDKFGQCNRQSVLPWLACYCRQTFHAKQMLITT